MLPAEKLVPIEKMQEVLEERHSKYTAEIKTIEMREKITNKINNEFVI